MKGYFQEGKWQVIFFGTDRSYIRKVGFALYQPGIHTAIITQDTWIELSKNGNYIDEITPKEGAFVRLVVPEAEAQRARTLVDKFLMDADGIYD